MIQYPPGPLLEMGFYFGALDEVAALKRVFRAFLDCGATYQGRACVVRGEGAQCRGFEAISDFEDKVDERIDLDKLLVAFKDQNVRILKLGIFNVLGFYEKSPGVITYDTISADAVGRDRHPIIVWTACSEDEHGSHRYYDPTLDIAKSRFIEIIGRVRPDYGCYNIEWGIMCPYDLNIDPKEGLFRAFYVSEGFMGEARIAQVLQLFSDAEIKYVADGVFIHSTKGDPLICEAEMTLKALIVESAQL